MSLCLEAESLHCTGHCGCCNRKWQRGGAGQQPNQSHSGESHAKCATFLTMFNDSNTPLSLRGFLLLSSKERNGKNCGLGLDGGGVFLL